MAARKVLVIGGGLAGLSASIEAAKLGAEVTLLDKEQRIGGNSAKASSGINGAPTATQKEHNIEDNTSLFRDDTLKSGAGICQTELVDVLTESSNGSIEFLKSFGVHLDALSQCGGHSRPRTHRAKPIPGKPSNIGWEIISTLQTYVNNNMKDHIKIVTGAKVTELLTDDKKRVNGVKYQHGTDTVDVTGDAVVLATGGYSADPKGFLQQYAPQIAHLPTTNGPFATGDGVRLALKLGAQLSLMDKVQIHPTSFVDPTNPNAPTKFLAPEALRGCGGILVNSNGERFSNELGLRDYVTNQIFAHCQPMKMESGENGPVVSYLLMNDKAVEDFGTAVLSFYKTKGMVKVFGNASEVAKAFNLDAQKLEKTINDYNEAAQKGSDSFGKKVFPVTFSTSEPFHVMLITPSIHYTMGGIKVNDKAQVIGENDSIIQGLFAAGEVTGGLHGANRLAGNSLLECVVFGRIAGSNAAKQ